MKLVVLLSIATLVACDYSAPQPETPSDAFAAPEKLETAEPFETAKSFYKFSNFYRGAFPPTRFPTANFYSQSYFPSFSYPLKASTFSAQGILPPLSQVIPPQISQIVPPISQIVPPIFGNAHPALPAPSPVVPPQIFPPPSFSSVSQPLTSKFSYPYYAPFCNFPSTFSSTYSFPSSTLFSSQIQKPSKVQTEPLSTSYGPPASGPVEPEPVGPAESSAPFEPSPVSFPYEPAAPETPEPAPHKPAQEYGVPSNK